MTPANVEFNGYIQRRRLTLSLTVLYQVLLAILH